MDFCGDDYYDDENDARGIRPAFSAPAPIDEGEYDALLAASEYAYADRLAGDR